MLTTKQIIKEIGCKHLHLYKAEGCWFFQFDDYKATARYDTKTIYVKFLKDMSLTQWVEEGKVFVASMEITI